MSIEIVKQRLKSACGESTPKVVLLTGGWGEGKTHQWRMALKESQAQGKPPKFAYLSLFGVNSLADARRRLAEEFVAAIRVPGEEGTLGSKVSEITTTTKYMQAIKLLPLVPFLGRADALLNELSFFVVRNAVICIDDIERKGANLSVADIFGLASFLKDERGCRVVLVANNRKLQGTDAAAAQTFMEKVVDEHVHFAPTSEEACAIALGAIPSKPALMLRDHLLSLNITNIRVIGRLHRLVNELAHTVAGVDEKVLKIGVLALAVFGVAQYMPDDGYPTIEFAIRRSEGDWLSYVGVRSNNGAPPSEVESQHAKWDELLSRVGRPSNDAYEVALADAVRNGFLGTNLRQLAEDLAGRLGMRELADQHHRAWTDFWHSLSGDGDELLNSLEQTTRAALPALGPGDLRQCYDLFVAVGREAQADALLAEFIEVHQQRPQIFDRSGSAFPEHFSGKFGELLDAAAAKYIVQPTTEEVLDRLDIHAYNPADASLVARASPETLQALLKASTGRKFRSRIRVLLALGTMAPNDPVAAAASAQFSETLRSWSDADPITAIRLRQYVRSNPDS